MGVPAPATMTLVVAALLAMAYTRIVPFRRAHRDRVGAFELVFLLVAWQAHPSRGEIATGFVSIPLGEPKYLYLASANIGAVIMPWMVFFQQSSVVEKKLKAADIGAERIDTAIGAVITQIIMAAVLIATAATLGKRAAARRSTRSKIAEAITPFLGEIGGKLLFGARHLRRGLGGDDRRHPHRRAHARRGAGRQA
jgi:Mn2+/Fe2+ NRAMP family transporter